MIVKGSDVPPVVDAAAPAVTGGGAKNPRLAAISGSRVAVFHDPAIRKTPVPAPNLATMSSYFDPLTSLLKYPALTQSLSSVAAAVLVAFVQSPPALPMARD